MARSIENILNDIDNAIYGRDVRSAIHDGISMCYTDISTATTLANSATDRANTAAANVEQGMEAGTDLLSRINGYVTSVDTSRNQAQNYASSASSSASSASASASNAAAYRDKAKDYRDDAEGFKNAASASSRSASDSASDASTYASNAQAYAGNASTSANNAAASAGDAEEFRNEAKTHATNAQTYAGNASTSASRAATSESNAAASAASAATSESNAATSASNASASETNALGYRNEAEEFKNTSSNNATASSQDRQTVENLYADIMNIVPPGTLDAMSDYADRTEAAATRAETSVRDLDDAINNAETQAAAAKAAADSIEDYRSGTLVPAYNSIVALRDQINGTYIPSINNKISEATAAVSQANVATSEANSAVSAAHPLIADMQTSIEDWYDRRVQIDASLITMGQSTNRADSAADAIENMTVTSESVGPNVPASAQISDVDGHKNIHFLLQKGDTGPSYTIKGRAFETLEDLEFEIDDPEVGDQYNVGSAPPYVVYRWTGDGWESQGTVVASVAIPISTSEIDNIYSGTQIADKEDKYLGIDGLIYLTGTKVQADLNSKVDKVAGKNLSTNDFTNEYKSKVDSNATNITALGSNKVDKVTGKGLSSNDFTNTYKQRIDSNTQDISALSSSKLNKDFSAFTGIESLSWLNGLFPVYYNGDVYKINGSDLVTDLSTYAGYISQSNIATDEEVESYFGI